MRLIVGDTETTGKARPMGVCEIAWMELDEDLNVIDEVASMIDPEMPIEFGAIAVHGIYPEHVADSPTLTEFFNEVKPNHFGDDEVVLIGHNIQFDKPFFDPYMKLRTEICTLRLARVFLPDSEAFNLGTLAVQYNLNRGTAHRALGDCLTTLELLKLIQQQEQRPVMELHNEAVKPRLLKKFPNFGKHANQAFETVPTSYCRWQLDNNKDMDIDLKFTCEARFKK